MILDKEQLLRLNMDTSKYLVLNISHFQYDEDLRKFETAINVLNCINTFDWINEACGALESATKIETKIFYVAIDCVLNETQLDSMQQTAFFNEIRKVEHFTEAIKKMADTSLSHLGYELPTEACISVHGLSISKQYLLEKNSLLKLHKDYSDLYLAVIFKEVTIEKHLKETQKLIADIRSKQPERLDICKG